MGGGWSKTHSSSVSAYDVVHGRLCSCGQHRGRTYTREGIHDHDACPSPDDDPGWAALHARIEDDFADRAAVRVWEHEGGTVR